MGILNLFKKNDYEKEREKVLANRGNYDDIPDWKKKNMLDSINRKYLENGWIAEPYRTFEEMMVKSKVDGLQDISIDDVVSKMEKNLEKGEIR